MHSECPECREPWRVGAKLCRTCGYRVPGAPEQAAPDRWRCADVERGMRCGKAGTLSPSTSGGGPWYCADHFPAFRAMRSAKVDRAYGAQRIGEIAAKFMRPVVDAEAELERAAIQAEDA